MKKVDVRAGGSEYEVIVGPFASENVTAIEASSRFIISDKNVWQIYEREWEGIADGAMILPAGEVAKNVHWWKESISWLVNRGADRNSLLIAMGGGVVGDLAGFVAATYMRGIRYVNVATSLVAQVDSAIGGKTAIDLPEGKNLVGSFHHPLAVWCCPRFLKTLPEKHYCNGMAEALKYGFIMDAEYLRWQTGKFEALRSKDETALEHLIHTCCQLKAGVVAEDPKETSGRRAILNFGHTIGHAIEKAMNYEGLLHGEAVSIGMRAEAELGERLRVTEQDSAKVVKEALERWGLPTSLPSKGLIEPVLEAMAVDKKNVGGTLSMALLERIGSCHLVRDIDAGAVREVLTML